MCLVGLSWEFYSGNKPGNWKHLPRAQSSESFFGERRKESINILTVHPSALFPLQFLQIV